jgi:AAA domain, putative AbiEii toxin, Type IV TA system
VLAVYIEKITIQNVKLIRDQTISFLRDGKPRMWTVIVGENGSCKTTILQAIALAAVGPNVANKLVEPLAFRDRRSNPPLGGIQARFRFGPRGHSKGIRVYPQLDGATKHSPHLFSQVIFDIARNNFIGRSIYDEVESDYLNINKKELHYEVTHNDKLSSIVAQILSLPTDQRKAAIRNIYVLLDSVAASSPLAEVRGKSLGHWFVAGYGPTRSLPVPKTLERSTLAAVERVSSLFSPTQIIGTGFADLFDGEQANAYDRILKQALLQSRDIVPKICGVELRRKGGVRSVEQLVETHLFEYEAGPNRVKVPATWLSQGYQAMISWIADLIGQFFWDYGGPVELEEMEGLVLIDELDIHLHPKWQVGLIKALKATFPHVQFVVTTHTAMVLPGLEADEVLRTRFDEEGNVVIEPVGQSPSLMTGSEIFSTFFGINSLYPEEVGEALLRYGYLASDSNRSDEEEAELQRILALLKKEGVEPGWEPKPRNGRPKAKKGTKRTPRK